MVFNVITVCIQLTVASEKKLQKTLENKNKIEINYKNEQIFYLPVIKNLKLLRLFILDLLLKAGADINIDSDTGITPLHVASLFPNKLILKLLFEMGADISKKTDQGKTFFDIANSTGLSCFIDHMKFKNFNFIDSNGNNLLWYAVKAKDFKRFEQLIQIKLKTDSLNNHGLSLIDYAKKIHASEENLTISDAFLFLDSDFDILKLPYHYKYLKKESEKIIDYLTEYTLIKNN